MSDPVREALTPPEQNSLLPGIAKTYRERQGDLYITKMAAVAGASFEQMGWEAEPEYGLFQHMIKNPGVTPAKMKVASVIAECLGRVVASQLEKQGGAAGILEFLKRVGGAGGAAASTTPELARLMLYLGAASGSAVGGGLWAAGRSTGGTDVKLRKLEIQRDTYNQLAGEVRKELAARKLNPTPANTAAAVDYLT